VAKIQIPVVVADALEKALSDPTETPSPGVSLLWHLVGVELAKLEGRVVALEEGHTNSRPTWPGDERPTS
jgi:hypothetical protein